MNNKNLIPAIIILIVALSAIVLAWLKITDYMVFKEKELRIRAVEGCMTSSTYEFEDTVNNITTIEPKKDIYEKCMKDKGYAD